MIKNDRFSISLPGGVDFIVREGIAYIGKTESENIEFSYPLSEGMNKIPGYDTIILVSKDKNYDCFLNIYKKSIQVKIKSDIINAGLYVRSRRDGDSYRFGNMTRKLKKILNDRGVLPSKRKDIPIFCDSCGILWVPGFSVRDGAANGEDWYITLLDPISADAKTQCFVIADN